VLLKKKAAQAAFFVVCAQHGRTPAGASPAVSWSQRTKWSATAWGWPSVGRKRGA